MKRRAGIARYRLSRKEGLNEARGRRLLVDPERGPENKK